MTANGPKFAVDQMVIKLGKYLRILGYDAVWDSSLRTHELILWANREQRILVTRNTRLDSEYPRVARRLQLTVTDPVEQLRIVLQQLDLARRIHPFSRCIRCNVCLAPVTNSSDIRDRVHPNVYSRYHNFFTCPSCHTVFWKGTHVRNTSRKLGIPDTSETATPRNDA